MAATKAASKKKGKDESAGNSATLTGDISSQILGKIQDHIEERKEESLKLREGISETKENEIKEPENAPVLDAPQQDEAPTAGEEQVEEQLTPDEAEAVVEKLAEEQQEKPKPAPILNEPPKEKEPEKKKVGKAVDPDKEINPLVKVALQFDTLPMLKGHSQKERILNVADFLSSKSPEWWLENAHIFVTAQNMTEHRERESVWNTPPYLGNPQWRREKKGGRS